MTGRQPQIDAPVPTKRARGNDYGGALTPKPQLHYEPNELRLVFRFSSAYLDNLRGGGVQRTAPDEKWGEKTAATRLRIARAMRRNPRITIVELAAELGVASTSGIEKHLKAMRDVGCIRRAGPAKGGHWEVRL